MNNQIITVNLIPGLSTPAVIRVSQYDVGRPLTIRVFDGTGAASFGASVTATIVGTKPSGLGFTESGTIAGNTVTLNTTLAMTQERGMIPAEIRFMQTGEDIGTANFILAVEPSPHPEGTTDGTQETMQNLETRLQGEIDSLDQRIDAIEGDQSIIDDINELDARVTALEQGGSGLSQTEKNLILTLFSKAAYAESDAESAYDALENLWTTTTRTITYNLSNVVSSNTQTNIESGQPYSTALAVGQGYTLNSVSVTMGGVDITSTAYSSGTITIPSVTGNIVITATAVLAAQSITATYTQSGTVYDTDSLDSLKADLVVTANYAGGTSETVPASGYTLSGTLAVGTSTVTVEYAGLTTTFNVVVSVYVPTPVYELPSVTTFDGTNYIDTNIILQPSGNTDTDWTIALELTDTTDASGTLFDFGWSSNNSSHFAYFMYNTSRNRWCGYMAGGVGANGWVSKAAGTKRFVYTHTAGEATVTEYQKRGENNIESATISKAFNYAINTYIQAESIILGGTYDSSNAASASANGVTLNNFRIYRDVLDSSAITDFLENGVN